MNLEVEAPLSIRNKFGGLDGMFTWEMEGLRCSSPSPHPILHFYY